MTIRSTLTSWSVEKSAQHLCHATYEKLFLKSFTLLCGCFAQLWDNSSQLCSCFVSLCGYSSVCGWFVPLWCPILAFLSLLCIYLWCPVPLCCFVSLWLFCVSGCLVPLCTCFAHFYDLFSVFVVVLYPYFVMSCLFILISSLINPFIAHNNRAASMYPVHWVMTKYVNTTSLWWYLPTLPAAHLIGQLVSASLQTCIYWFNYAWAIRATASAPTGLLTWLQTLIIVYNISL